MKSNLKFAFVTALLLGAGSLSASPAFAGGFLADVVKAVVPDAAPIADALDKANGYGHPVDHAAAAVVDYYAPGAGEVAYGVWTHQLPTPQDSQ